MMKDGFIKKTEYFLGTLKNGNFYTIFNKKNCKEEFEKILLTASEKVNYFNKNNSLKNLDEKIRFEIRKNLKVQNYQKICEGIFKLCSDIKDTQILTKTTLENQENTFDKKKILQNSSESLNYDRKKEIKNKQNIKIPCRFGLLEELNQKNKPQIISEDISKFQKVEELESPYFYILKNGHVFYEDEVFNSFIIKEEKCFYLIYNKSEVPTVVLKQPFNVRESTFKEENCFRQKISGTKDTFKNEKILYGQKKDRNTSEVFINTKFSKSISNSVRDVKTTKNNLLVFENHLDIENNGNYQPNKRIVTCSDNLDIPIKNISTETSKILSNVFSTNLSQYPSIDAILEGFDLIRPKNSNSNNNQVFVDKENVNIIQKNHTALNYSYEEGLDNTSQIQNTDLSSEEENKTSDFCVQNQRIKLTKKPIEMQTNHQKSKNFENNHDSTHSKTNNYHSNNEYDFNKKRKFHVKSRIKFIDTFFLQKNCLYTFKIIFKSSNIQICVPYYPKRYELGYKNSGCVFKRNNIEDKIKNEFNFDLKSYVIKIKDQIFRLIPKREYLNNEKINGIIVYRTDILNDCIFREIGPFDIPFFPDKISLADKLEKFTLDVIKQQKISVESRTDITNKREAYQKPLIKHSENLNVISNTNKKYSAEDEFYFRKIESGDNQNDSYKQDVDYECDKSIVDEDSSDLLFEDDINFKNIHDLNSKKPTDIIILENSNENIFSSCNSSSEKKENGIQNKRNISMVCKYPHNILHKNGGYDSIYVQGSNQISENTNPMNKLEYKEITNKGIRLIITSNITPCINAITKSYKPKNILELMLQQRRNIDKLTEDSNETQRDNVPINNFLNKNYPQFESFGSLIKGIIQDKFKDRYYIRTKYGSGILPITYKTGIFKKNEIVNISIIDEKNYRFKFSDYNTSEQVKKYRSGYRSYMFHYDLLIKKFIDDSLWGSRNVAVKKIKHILDFDIRKLAFIEIFKYVTKDNK